MNNCLECKKLTGGLCEKCFKEQDNNGVESNILPECNGNPQKNGIHQWEWINDTGIYRWRCIFCGIKI